MSCNCKRVRNVKELSEVLRNQQRQRIHLSFELKMKLFAVYILYSIRSICDFGYNLFKNNDLRGWINH